MNTYRRYWVRLRESHATIGSVFALSESHAIQRGCDAFNQEPDAIYAEEARNTDDITYSA